MPSECPVCHAYAVDTEPGEDSACRECGAVVENTIFTSENDSRKGSTFMFADGTARFNDRSALPQAVRQRLPTGDKGRAYRLLNKCLNDLVRRMNLSDQILQETREFLFNRVRPLAVNQPMGLPKKRSILVASCLYIVCRQNSMPLTFRAFSQKAECSMFHLGKIVKNIQEAVGVRLEPLVLQELVSDLLSQFEASEPSCETLALSLSEICRDSYILPRANDILNAIALVMLVLEFKKRLPRKDKLVEVMSKHVVKERELKCAVLKLKSNLLELAKQVPWITKSVTPKTICWHIQDIVNFNESCGKLGSRVVESQNTGTSREKEVRIEKIKKAKQRILKSLSGDNNGKLQSTQKNTERTCACNCHKSYNKKLNYQGESSSASCPEVTIEDTRTDRILAADSDQCKEHVCHCAEACHANGLHLSDNEELDGADIVIEDLLQRGCPEEELIDGCFGSRGINLQSNIELDVWGDREELDENDIPDKDMHQYLFPVSELAKRYSITES